MDNGATQVSNRRNCLHLLQYRKQIIDPNPPDFSEATPGAVTVTCPNAGEPYDFSWKYQNGNLVAGTLRDGAQVFHGTGQSSIVTGVTCGFD